MAVELTITGRTAQEVAMEVRQLAHLLGGGTATALETTTGGTVEVTVGEGMDAGVPTDASGTTAAEPEPTEETTEEAPAIRATAKKKKEAAEFGAKGEDMPDGWADNETLLKIWEEAQAEAGNSEETETEEDGDGEDDGSEETETEEDGDGDDDELPEIDECSLEQVSQAVDKGLAELGRDKTVAIMTEACDGEFKKGRDMTDEERLATYNAIREAV